MGKWRWRKWLNLCMIAALLVGAMSSAAYGQAVESGNNFAAGGIGTQNDPYRIETVEQLTALASWVNDAGQLCTDQYFTLEQDLELSGMPWTPIGKGSKAFGGNFDGQGHTISGLRMNAAENYCGLFGKISGGSIINLIIREVSVREQQYVGALAGMATDTIVSGCNIEGGEIYGKSWVGGIVGCLAGDSMIIDCESSVNLDNNNGSYIGGIAGYMKDTACICNCCNQGNISGKEAVGGIAGNSYKGKIKIQNCYNKGTVAASDAEEGAALLGRATMAATLAYCYYDEASSSRAYLVDNDSLITQVSAVDNRGQLLTSITLGDRLYTDVRTVLNDWVDKQEELHRHWQADGLCARYPISFSGDNGEVLARTWGEDGQLLAEPLEAPMKKGYTCVGWSSDGQALWRFGEDRLTKPLELRPLWQPEQITLEPTEITLVGQVGGQAIFYDLGMLQISHDSDGLKSYRVQKGQELPQGLHLDADGILTGQPTEVVQDQALVLILTGANGTEAEVMVHLTILPAEIEKYCIHTQVTAGGAIVPEQIWLAAGQDQMFEIKAEPGYAVAEVLLDGRSLGAVTQYKLLDVHSEHSLEARFVWRGAADGDGDNSGADWSEPVDKKPLMPAREVPAKETVMISEPYADTTGHWAVKAIDFVSEKGLMKGIAPGTFGPEETVTRSMIAVVLWRSSGEPPVEAGAAFHDVNQDQWYASAVAWAAGQGVMNGRTAEGFAPEAALSRQELAVLLYRWSHQGAVSDETILQHYTDSGDTAPWAMEAMNWAVKNELLVGRTPERLQPQDSLTRAELAVVLQRFYNKIDL